MCDMQHGTLECRGDGYLWDADCDGYDPNDISQPCPQCNTKAFLLYAKEEAESVSNFSGMYSSGTGVTIWEGAVRAAKYWNEESYQVILGEIGKVVALENDDERVFEYSAVSIGGENV